MRTTALAESASLIAPVRRLASRLQAGAASGPDPGHWCRHALAHPDLLDL